MSEIIFKSANNHYFVEISIKSLNKIKEECIKAKEKETGGILIGNYSEDKNIAIIKSITGPPKDSKNSKNSFIRGVDELMDLLDSKWNLNEYYIGEWHFHPNSSSKPSFIDNIQMKKLSIDKHLKCPVPILLIMGGNQFKGWKLSVNVYKKNHRLGLIKIS